MSALVGLTAAPGTGPAAAEPAAATADAAADFGDALSLILAGTSTAAADKQTLAEPGSKASAEGAATAAPAAADPAGVVQPTQPNFRWPLAPVVGTSALAAAAAPDVADPGSLPQATAAGNTLPAASASAPVATAVQPEALLPAAVAAETPAPAAARPAHGEVVTVPRKTGKQTAPAPTDPSSAVPPPANMTAQTIPAVRAVPLAGEGPVQGLAQAVSVSTGAAAGDPAAIASGTPKSAQAPAPTAVATAVAAPAATFATAAPATTFAPAASTATFAAAAPAVVKVGAPPLTPVPSEGGPSPVTAGAYLPGPPALTVGPGPAPAALPAIPPGFAAQLARPIFTLASAGVGSHTVVVAVNPENLGPVTVQAHISAAGVRIELFASNAEGREVLRQSLPELKRDLTGAGLDASLDLSSDSQPGQDSREQFFSRRAASTMPLGPENPHTPANGSAPRVSSGLYGIDGSLDVMA